MFSVKENTQRYKSPRGFAIFPCGSDIRLRLAICFNILAARRDMLKRWDLYHIALEWSDNISHEQSEYIAFACKHIAKQKKEITHFSAEGVLRRGLRSAPRFHPYGTGARFCGRLFPVPFCAALFQCFLANFSEIGGFPRGVVPPKARIVGREGIYIISHWSEATIYRTSKASISRLLANISPSRKKR